MKFDIVGGSYRNRYIAVDPEQTINWYVHKIIMEGDQDKEKHALYSFPGLTQFADTTLTNGRSIFVARSIGYERCFTVWDNVLYELDELGTLTSRGTMSAMTSDSTSVYMAVNGNHQVMICSASASYIFNMSTDVLTQITDGDFPSNPTYLTYTQGYFVVTAGGRVYYSALNDGTSWDGADVFTPTALADPCLAAVVWRDDLHCFGSESIEIYINDGATPFVKQDRSTINIGVVAVDTISVFESGILFLGRMRNGQKKVYYYNGQTCTAVSNFDIDWQLNNPSTLGGETWENLDTYTWDNWFDAWDAGDLTSYAELQYSKDGHVFYYLTVPSLNTTYVFDVSTQEWVERQSINPTSSQQKFFRCRHLTNFKGINLWTDLWTGKIFKEDFTSATEDGNVLTRTRIGRVWSEEKKNIAIYEFEVDSTTGSGLISTPATAANMAFYYSRNGGNTYSSATNLSTGASGVYTQRPRTFKIGQARDWAFKLVVTDAADLCINAVYVRGTVSAY